MRCAVTCCCPRSLAARRRRPGRWRVVGESAGRARAGATGDLDSAILDVVSTARPPVGRTRAVEILRGGRSKVVVQYAYDGLPDYGAFAHLRSDGRARARRSAARGRHAALDRRALPEAARGMNVAVLASGTGTNLQALIDRAHGRDGVEIVAVASDKPDAPALERARAAGIPTRSVRASTSFPTGPRAIAAIAAWLRERGVELVVLAGYMQLLSAEFLDRVSRAGDQRPPGAAAGVPRPARGPAGARLRRQGVRGHRPLRRRRRRHRAGASSSGRSSCRTRRSPTRCWSGCTRSSTSCCVEAVRADRAGRGQLRSGQSAAGRDRAVESGCDGSERATR